MTPTSGTIGTAVIFNLQSSAYPIGGDYKLKWSPSPQFEEEKTTTLVDGTIPLNSMSIVASFVIPDAPYGVNFIMFQRLARDEPVIVQFTVKPSIKISPASVGPGSTVTITGAGFPVDDTGVLTFDSKKTDVPISVNKKGSFNVQYTIPNTMAGEHKFTVETTKIFTEAINIKLMIGPAITLNPELPDIGATVTLTGRGFAANSGVEIKYDDITIADSPTTDVIGYFTHEFKIPESPLKEHKIVARDKAGNIGTCTLPLEGKPPAKPEPLSPTDQSIGFFGKQTIPFSWKGVSDSSGVTYTVEVSDNLKFFPLKPGMRKAGVAKPDCTMDIEPGTYYWRVMAIDGVGNKSEWEMSPYAFKVGLFSFWALIIGILVFILVFLLLIRTFFRRLREYYH